MQDAALFADMLSCRTTDVIPHGVEPQPRGKRRWGTDQQVAEVVASQNPVLMILEDAHWADPTSLEASTGGGSGLTQPSPATGRNCSPRVPATLAGRSHVTALSISRLTQREAEAMIAAL